MKLVLILVIFCFAACNLNVDERTSEKESLRLIEYPAPFYWQNTGSGILVFYGVETKRFTYVENTEGPWLLFDNYIDSVQPINLVNLDEYIFIQLELKSQLKDLLEKKKIVDDWLGINLESQVFKIEK